ncbi:MAG TPA: hypothetical protein VHS78_02235 [Candidatus Elarobacter sp.]|nr:hypothetical protein [Candidatus Elarobacter sp.]
MRLARLGLALAVALSGCAHGGGARTVPSAGGGGPGAVGTVRAPRSIGPMVQSAAAANTTYNNTLSVTLGSSPRAGDLLLVGVSWSYDPSSPTVPVTPPSGWNLVKRVDNPNSVGFALYSRVADGTEGTTLTWNVGPSGDQHAITLSAKEISGEDSSKPIDAVASQSAGIGRSLSVSATATRAGDLGVAYFAQYYETNNPLPTGFTAGSGWTISEQQHGYNSMVMAQSQVQNAVNAGTGTITASESWSNGQNSNQTGVIALVEPAVGAGNGTITLVQGATASSSNANASSISVSLPSAPATGDVLLASVHWGLNGSEDYASIQAPAGWSHVDSVSYTNYDGIAIFTKAVESGEAGGPYAFTTTNTTHALAVTLDEVNGADVSRPANVFHGATQGSGYSMSISTASSPTVNNGLAVAFFDQYNNGTANPTGFTAGSGYTLRATTSDTTKVIEAQELVGTGGTTSGTGVTASESWQNGENSSMVAEIVVLAPKPPVVASGGPTYQGCPILPPDHPMNTDISGYPVDPNSANYMNEMSSGGATLSPQFGNQAGLGPQGVPINVVNEQPSQYVTLYYQSDGGDYMSDHGDFPIPANAQIEQQSYYGTRYSDHHMIVLNTANCTSYEVSYVAEPYAPWTVYGSSVIDLRSDALLPEGWGGVDAAGLPYLPMLIRGDEVQAGAITHAMAVHVAASSAGHIHPAVHDASYPSSPPAWAPPMGMRLRLKSSFDMTKLNGYPVTTIIAKALQKYGMYVMDNGAPGYLEGDTSDYLDSTTVSNDVANGLTLIKFSDFEVVQTGSIIPNSTARAPKSRGSAVRR